MALGLSFVSLLAAAIFLSTWLWFGAFIVAIMLLGVCLASLRRRAARRPSQQVGRGGAGNFAGVVISAASVVLSGLGIVLDHPPGIFADDGPYAIIVPSPGSTVGQCVRVRGLGRPPQGHQLWTFVQSVGSGMYYPGRPVVFDRMAESPSWSAPTEVGLENQPSDDYAIVAAVLDLDVSRIWIEALPTSGGGSSELPQGSVEVARIAVTRRAAPDRHCATVS